MIRASTEPERTGPTEPTTVAMPRDELVGLVAATADRVHVHTVPRDHLPRRDWIADEDLDGPSVSPLAVLAVISLLIALFIAVTNLD